MAKQIALLPPEVLYGLGALVLLALLVWGVVQYKRRSLTR